jgi:hypothetical protein
LLRNTSLLHSPFSWGKEGSSAGNMPAGMPMRRSGAFLQIDRSFLCLLARDLESGFLWASSILVSITTAQRGTA